MPSSDTTASAESLTSTSSSSRKPSYWSHMVSHYEKRNASLEQRQTELSERIRLMECAVPSLLMGAMVSMKRNADPTTRLSASNPKTLIGEQTSSSFHYNADAPEGKKVNGRPDLTRFCKNTTFRP